MIAPKRLRPAWLLVLLAALGLPCLAEEPDVLPEGETFRTEADDLAETDEEPESRQLGSLGAVSIPFEVEAACTGTLALYTPGGQLVRILGQALDFRPGPVVARWDGLDLFGNVVPAGTELAVTLITNPGLRAVYEFSVGGPADPPWGTRPEGEGLAMRAGGWLGDHSCPGAAVAVGERVLLGCFLAEHGSNMIAVDGDGHKLWGGKLDGWSGPVQFATDGTDAYALLRRGQAVYRVDPATGERRRLLEAGPDAIRCIAAAPGRLLSLHRSHERDVSPFRRALGKGRIDFAASRPQVLETSAPTEFHISPQAAFGNVFTEPGNPQNHARLIPWNGEGFIVLVFKEPVQVGTVLLGYTEGVEKAQVYVLKEGLVFDHDAHSPLRETGDAILDSFNLAEFDTNWERLGETRVADPLNFVTAPRDGMRTRAMYLKYTPEKKPGPGKAWTAGLSMARILAERIAPVPVVGRLHLPASIQGNRGAGPTGWNFLAEVPASDIYPAAVVYDFGAETTFDGLVLLNCTSPSVFLDVYTGDPAADPRAAPDTAWREVARYKGPYNKKLRHLSASRKSNEHFIELPDRTTTRAVRFRATDGYRHGKWGQGGDNPYLVECHAVALVRTLSGAPRPPAWIVRVTDPATGQAERELRGDDLHVDAMACGPDGTLYTVTGNTLNRTALTETGLAHTVLAEGEIAEALSMAVSADRIAVGDGARGAVLLFSRDGRLQTVIGDRGRRQRGPWDPNVIEAPRGVAIDARGNVWVAEQRFAPKRVARFGPDGAFRAEFTGPPMYGGGGYLDPTLRRFYYRSVEHALDWDAGTSRVAALNDRLHAEASPALEGSSFAYTGIGRPIYHNGRRYIVGGTVICQLPEGAHTWKPCVVMGSALRSPFLHGKAAWNRHWARLDLRGKGFIWCDRNDDGGTQIKEVELFDEAAFPDLFRGLTIGPDLTLWGTNARAVPSGWTDGGCPIFTFADFRPFAYDKLAPHYPRNYTLGGPRSAKPGYFGFKWILRDGSLIQEGQPYVVTPEMTIRGGPVTAAPTDYIPPIHGTVQSQPWTFAGSAVTESPLGEVACVNSNNGYWYVWAARYGCVVGTFFDGSEGGWGTGLAAERGTDVTGRKQSWEGWGAHFLKADDGRYYAVAGKGFHGISRIEGLDDFQVRTWPLRVPEASVAANTRLRTFLRDRYHAMKAAGSKSGRKELLPADLAKRVPQFRCDGEIQEWGKRSELHAIGPARRKLVFDLAPSERGLALALAGETKLGKPAADWKTLFAHGFACEFVFRTDGRARGRDLVAGDRRLVIGKVGQGWTAVLYDYIDPAAPEGAGLVLASDVVEARIARVTRLGQGDLDLAVKESGLGIDLKDLGGLDLEGFGEEPALPGSVERTPAAPTSKDVSLWSMELFIPWKTLGLSPGARVRCDVGVRFPTADGTGAERLWWSNRAPAPTGDPAVEAALLPGTWGTIQMGK